MEILGQFGDFPEQYTAYGPSKVVLLPIPYEATTTYLQGTREGPGAILEASRALEHYDEELDAEPYLVGIHTAGEASLPHGPAEDVLRRIQQVSEVFVQDGKFLLGIGGEHTVTVGLVRAQAARHPGLTVVQLDAHADLRDSYEGDRYNHACVMRRVLEACPVVSLGVRALDRTEMDCARRMGVKLFTMWEMRRDRSWLDRALSGLCGPVYLTVDLDVMDPALMPAVGTPEPGGLGWYEMLYILRKILERCHVIGGDVVELCPASGPASARFVAAKMLYKIIGYRFFRLPPPDEDHSA